VSHSINRKAKGSAPIVTPTKRERIFSASLIPFAWRLPNGIKSASDRELELSGDACERLSWVCGGVVAVGVLAEVAIAWCHPPYDSFWEHWGSVIANGVVMLGVAGEVQFSRMAFRRDKELKRRSDDKVSEAKLETERLKSEIAWRTLTAETVAALKGVLDKNPAHSVIFSYLANDVESQVFVSQFSAVFRSSGWEVCHRVASFLGDIEFGILIPNEENRPDGWRAISFRVQAVFEAAKIDFSPRLPPEPFSYTGSNEPIREGAAFVYIGPKGIPLSR
jgi:hypothetical protein